MLTHKPSPAQAHRTENLVLGKMQGLSLRLIGYTASHVPAGVRLPSILTRV